MESLIANSGIQFFRKTLILGESDRILPSMVFCEVLGDSYEKEFDYAVKVPDKDFFVRKKELFDAGLIEKDSGEIVKEFDSGNFWQYGQELDEFAPDKDQSEFFYQLNSRNIKDCVRSFENKWLPFPYFRVNNEGFNDFGPYAWSRFLIKDVTPKRSEEDDDEKEQYLKFEVIVAFDTTVAEDNYSSTYFTPKYRDFETNDSHYSLVQANDYLLLNFCSEGSNCAWVRDYLEDIHQVDKQKTDLSNGKAFGHLAKYIFLVKYLASAENFYFEKVKQKEKELEHEEDAHERAELKKELNIQTQKLASNSFPKIRLFTDKPEGKAPIEVSLVVDIGNFETCGLLFEHDRDKPFDFKSVKKLELTDLSVSHFGKVYDEPFSMRLAFSKVLFGEGRINTIDGYPGGPDKAFRWPGMVRIGKEARRLINLHRSNSDDDNGESATNCSSPKRYLWDDEPAPIPWEFVNNELPYKSHATYAGISEQFQNGGKFCYKPAFGLDPNYSRSSLMTFVFMEIFLHAQRQINSVRFRDRSPDVPRILSKVLITCPTSVVKQEQVVLRRCALEAGLALKRFSNGDVYQILEEGKDKPDFEILPPPEDIEKSADERMHWNYDEASCSQLLVMYAEIARKYQGNSHLYFENFGRTIENKSNLTVASLDIGGGTTDLMICRYESNKGSSIKPNPKFWESFTTAGDDLIYEIVRSILLEGETLDHHEIVGIIKKYALRKGCNDVPRKMRRLWSKGQPYAHPLSLFRKAINTQLLIPIAIKMLDHIAKDKDDTNLSFNEIFDEVKPSKEVLLYINDFFGNGFDFKEIVWSVNARSITLVIRNVFSLLFEQIAFLIDQYMCDIVLLSGKLTGINEIRNMFVLFFPVSPDRIINMSDYRIGDWYQFSRDGYIQDSKTIVPYGAIVALMGGFYKKLPDFSIDISKLKTISTTSDYIGAVNSDKLVPKVYLTPTRSDNEVSIDLLPLKLGYKQFASKNYPGRPLYKLVFNTKSIEEAVKKKHGELEREELTELTTELETALNNSVATLSLNRLDYSSDKEKIEVNLLDADGAIIGKDLYKLKLMTLNDEDSYWADTGEFGELFRSKKRTHA